MKLREQIGKVIADARNLEGISQEELAERCGMPTSYICWAEEGSVLSITQYEVILANLKYAENYKFIRQHSYDPVDVKRLGELNMLSALGKITDSEEEERRKLLLEMPLVDPTGF